MGGDIGHCSSRGRVFVAMKDIDLANFALESYEKSNIWSGNSCVQVSYTGQGIVIAFRGTNDPIDFMADLWAVPWKPKQLGAWVHRGFWLYVEPLIDMLLEKIDASGAEIHLTGHSLGGAAACIFAAVCRRRGIRIESLTTFGAPKPGFDSLADKIWDIPGKRFVVDGDQVTMVPPGWVLPYVHDRAETTLPGIDGPIDHPMQNYVDALVNTPHPD